MEFSGKGSAAQVAGMLARPDYCEKWQDAALTEVGIYQDARQVWIVLAAPFSPVAAMNEEAAARRHSDDMARLDFLSHDGRDGSTAEQRVERAGYHYRAMGENIAGGQTRPEDAVADWIASPGHCANLMNPAFTEMGVAVAVNGKSRMGVYWTLEFGTPR